MCNVVHIQFYVVKHETSFLRDVLLGGGQRVLLRPFTGQLDDDDSLIKYLNDRTWIEWTEGPGQNGVLKIWC